MLLEAHEEHLIRQLRTPLERDDLDQSLQRISEHEVPAYEGVILILAYLHTRCCLYLNGGSARVSLQKKTAELNKLKEDLDVLKEKCELFLREATASPSVSKLSSELTVLLQSMSQVYSMSSIYMDK